MVFKVLRDVLAVGFTLGKLNHPNGKQLAFTVEDEVREKKIKGVTAVPFGKYELALRYSPKFSDSFYADKDYTLIEKKAYLKLSIEEKKKYTTHQLIWVKNVPEFEYILIHWGNWAKDTDGCLLIGNTRLPNGIGDSRSNYMKTYPIIARAIRQERTYIEYIKPLSQ